MTDTRFFVVRQRCPVCASRRLTRLCDLPFTEPPVRSYLEDFYLPQGTVEFEYLEGESFVLEACEDCHLVFQRSIPNETLMHIIYERWIDPAIAYSAHVTLSGLDYHSRIAQEIMQLIAAFDRAPSSLRFFDFGMGWGEWALMAKVFGCEAFGAELSTDRIDRAEANGIRVIEWDEIPNLECDFINTEQVFEHIAEPGETLRHLKLGLKPRGLIKISVPNGTDIRRRLKRMDWGAAKGTRHSLNPVAPLEHINCYGRRTISTLADSAGLQVTTIPLRPQYRYMTNWGSPRAIARNALLPLKRKWRSGRTYVLLQKTG